MIICDRHTLSILGFVTCDYIQKYNGLLQDNNESNEKRNTKRNTTTSNVESNNSSFLYKFYKVLSQETSHPSTSSILNTLSILHCFIYLVHASDFIVSFTLFDSDLYINNIAFHLILVCHGMVAYFTSGFRNLFSFLVGKKGCADYEEVRDMSSMMMEYVGEKHGVVVK